MAINYTEIDMSRPTGHSALDIQSIARNLQSKTKELKEFLDNCVDGDGTFDSNYQSIETLMGLTPTVNPGQVGRGVYNKIAGMHAHLQSSADANAISFQSVLDHFVQKI